MFASKALGTESKRSVVGIAGGSGSGKTTLVQTLIDRFGDVCVVDLDSYYLDRSEIGFAERRSLNYDEPSAFDVALLLDHLRRLAAGETVRKPSYSFASHTRIGTEPATPTHLTLVDGLFTFWWSSLRALLDMKIYVDAPPDVRLARRIRRDVRERGRDVESILSQYLSTVRPMHERYIEPTRAHADLIVTNDGPIEDCVERIMTVLRERVAMPLIHSEGTVTTEVTEFTE